MKSELRENMYIRTNEGIRKILNEFEEGYELDDVTKLKLMATIKNNLNNDTYTLRKKLIDVWKEI